MRARLIFTANLIALAIFYISAFADERQKIQLKTTVDHVVLSSELKEKIPDLMERALIPGLSMAVIRDGKIFWRHEFGIKNVETGEPVTDDTVFEAASLSKPVFAYGVMKLVDQGKLDLDKPLIDIVSRSYLERVDPRYKTDDERFSLITARMVLTHSTGFANWFNGRPLSIAFQPGENFSYSGEAFDLLARVVEKITGVSLADFMNETVLKPLGMHDSSYVWIDQYKSSFSGSHNRFARLTLRDRKTTASAGATLYTTALDFAKFVLAIINDIGMRKPSFYEMLHPQIEAYKERTEGIFWGLGFGLNHTDQGKSIWHWGDNGEFKCYFEAFKQEKTGLVFFANSHNAHAITESLMLHAIGQNSPGIRAIPYPRYHSSTIRLYHTYRMKVAEKALEYFNEVQNNKDTKGSITEDTMALLGQDAMQQKEYDQALRIFNTANNAFPESAILSVGLGHAYLAKNDKDKARQYFETILAKDPEMGLAKMGLLQIEPFKPNQYAISAILGTYSTPNGSPEEIWQEDGKLYAGRNRRELVAESNDTYWIWDGRRSYRINFERDNKGSVIGYRIQIGDQTFEGKKLK